MVRGSTGSVSGIPQRLRSQSGEKAIEWRQISANLTTCTSRIEIGAPTEVDIPSDEFLASSLDNPTTFRTRRATANTISQAYYQVEFQDIFHLKVNHVRPILTWTWSGSPCVVASSHDAGYWSQVGSGWYLAAYNWWKTTACNEHKAHADGDFNNVLFCIGVTVKTHYRDVRVRGGYAGGYNGGATALWSENSCAPLHTHGTLVKVF